jgi:hypothetical protein
LRSVSGEPGTEKVVEKLLTMYHDHVHASTSRFLSLQSLWFPLISLVIDPPSRPLTLRRQLFRRDLNIFAVFNMHVVGRREQREEDSTAGCDDVGIAVEFLFGCPGRDEVSPVCWYSTISSECSDRVMSDEDVLGSAGE